MFLTRWLKSWTGGFATTCSRPKRRPWRGHRLQVEQLEERTVLSGNNLAGASPINPTDVMNENISIQGEVDSFQITLTDSGRLTVQSQSKEANSLDTRLSLLGPEGQLLIQSDGISPNNADDLIVQHLLPGMYFLQVEGLGGGAGNYTLTTEFTAAISPFDPLPFELPLPVLTGDYNNDGASDFVVIGAESIFVSVFLGLGDGSFRQPLNSEVGLRHIPRSQGDFNGDGFLDLALGTLNFNQVTVVLGRGDGTFTEPVRYRVGTNGVNFVDPGDVTGDGILDLVTNNVNNPNFFSVLVGRGDGTFEDEIQVSVENPAGTVHLADLNGDGRDDVVIVNIISNSLSVLLSQGEGTFSSETQYAVGTQPFFAISADFNGDGHLDLATGNESSNDVSVLLGNGDGTFAPDKRFAAGTFPNGIVAGDFNGDGFLDLVTANGTSSDISVLQGHGDGTFSEHRTYTVGDFLFDIAASDFNSDGHLDLVLPRNLASDVSILLGRGDGTFPNQGRPVQGASALVLTAGDFNGDGRADLVVDTSGFGTLLVMLGLGDGLFQSPVPFDGLAQMIETYDFNGDGHADLIVNGSTLPSSVAPRENIVFLGRGDGTFERSAAPATVDEFSEIFAAADFDGDGLLDVATADLLSDHISVTLGQGDGTFQDPVRYVIGLFARGITAGDFDEDGIIDLIGTSVGNSQIAFLRGQGDGTFQDPVFMAAEGGPIAVLTRDFNGDGHLDLAILNHLSRDISVRQGRGDGTFAEEDRYSINTSVFSLVAGDFNGDNFLDLATHDLVTGEALFLFGKGDGTFEDPVRFQSGDRPNGLVVGDFNGDGQDDLAVANTDSNHVTLFLGNGQGELPISQRLPLGATNSGRAVTTADVNNDGRLDLVTANPNANSISVALGLGDGTFRPAVSLSVGTSPQEVVVGDFNRDGRLDVAVANHGSNDVTIALGLGSGTFRDPMTVAVGMRPTSLVLGDFNGDGLLDLATANSHSNDVSLLLGRGDGGFDVVANLPVGELPLFLTAGDFNGDGFLDLATTNYFSGDVSLLVGGGNGTFQAEVRVDAGTGPLSLAHGDFNRDGLIDLATAHASSNTVHVLLRRPNGTFQPPVQLAVGDVPRSLVVQDFNGDGFLDLAVANNGSDDVSLLLGRGNGTFEEEVRLAVGDAPIDILAADFTNDGRLDLVTANQLGEETSLLIGLGDGTFVTPGTITNAIRSTPLVADLTGDGISDVVVVNGRGDILLRIGRADIPGTFEAPVVINQGADLAARDLALVSTSQGTILAALNARNSSVSFYSRGTNGTFQRTGTLAVPGTLAVHLTSGDLNGDGLDDLVIVTSGSREVLAYLQDASGSFGLTPMFRQGVGVNPSDIALADVDGDQRLDIVITNEFSGDISVLLNTESNPFSTELRFRTGEALRGLGNVNGSLTIRSRENSTGVVAGQFDADSLTDVIVINSESNRFSLLRGTGSGGFLNPQTSLLFPTGSHPTDVVAGLFSADGHLDLAILNRDSMDVSIFLGDGQGGFTPMPRVSAGNGPTGLGLCDVNRDGHADLLIGNEFGDVLTLLGNGDGTFQPYQRGGRNIALAMADLNGDGEADFIFANEARDRVSVQYSQPGQSFNQERGDGLLAPGAVSSMDMNRDGHQDLIVANSGANNVLVYLGTGNGQFSTGRSFFAGTNPAGITLEDLNGDQVLDVVVANEGSNDVTVLLGQGEGTNWTLIHGPRLRAGAGPLSTTVQDVTGDAVPDILVSNRESNNVFLLPGVGGGFFNDQNPLTFAVGVAPQQTFVGNFDFTPGLDMVTINSGSNDLTFFSNVTNAINTLPGVGGPVLGAGRSIATGGAIPLAALANDFNSDGITDLMIANNGNGQVTLLLGDVNGPTLSQSFSRSDVLRPTSLGLLNTGDTLEVYVTEEGQESALLLTSFGIAVPSGLVGDANVLLTDVAIVSGPGFETGVDLVTTGGTGFFGAGNPFTGIADPSLVIGLTLLIPSDNTDGDGTGEGQVDSDTALAIDLLGELAGLLGMGTILLEDLMSGGREKEIVEEEETLPDGSQNPEARVYDLMIGLDEASRRRTDPVNDPAMEDSHSTDTILGAINEVFRIWLPEAAERARTTVQEWVREVRGGVEKAIDHLMEHFQMPMPASPDGSVPLEPDEDKLTLPRFHDQAKDLLPMTISPSEVPGAVLKEEKDTGWLGGVVLLGGMYGVYRNRYRRTSRQALREKNCPGFPWTKPVHRLSCRKRTLAVSSAACGLTCFAEFQPSHDEVYHD